MGRIKAKRQNKFKNMLAIQHSVNNGKERVVAGQVYFGRNPVYANVEMPDGTKKWAKVQKGVPWVKPVVSTV